jgi:hypothetical protein
LQTLSRCLYSRTIYKLIKFIACFEGEEKYIILKSTSIGSSKEARISSKQIQTIKISKTKEPNPVLKIKIDCFNKKSYTFTYIPFTEKEENALQAKLLRLLINSLKIQISLKTLPKPFKLQFTFVKRYREDYNDKIIDNLNNRINSLPDIDCKINPQEVLPILNFIEGLAASLKYDQNNLVNIATQECNFLNKGLLIDGVSKELGFICLNGVDPKGFFIVIDNEPRRISYTCIKVITFKNGKLGITKVSRFKEVKIEVSFDLSNPLESDIINKFVLLLGLFKYSKNTGIEIVDILTNLIFRTGPYQNFNMLMLNVVYLWEVHNMININDTHNSSIPYRMSMMKRLAKDIVDLPVYSVRRIIK